MTRFKNNVVILMTWCKQIWFTFHNISISPTLTSSQYFKLGIKLKYSIYRIWFFTNGYGPSNKEHSFWSVFVNITDLTNAHELIIRKTTKILMIFTRENIVRRNVIQSILGSKVLTII